MVGAEGQGQDLLPPMGGGGGQGTRKRWELSEAHKAGTAGHLQCHLVVPTALQEALVFPCFR